MFCNKDQLAWDRAQSADAFWMWQAEKAARYRRQRRAERKRELTQRIRFRQTIM